MWSLELAVMAAMVGFNGLFASYEIALATVSVARLQVLVREKRRGAAAALQMKQALESSLAAVQLGITLVGATAAATGGAGAEAAIAPLLRDAGLGPKPAAVVAIAAVVIPLTGLTIVLGELVPKLLALRHKEWVCLQLSPAVLWLRIAVWPAVWALENSATLLTAALERFLRVGGLGELGAEEQELQDLRAVASLARAARLIGPHQENIILNAARLSSRPVGEIVLPADHINMLSVDAPVADCLAAANLDLHTRFPVTEVAGDPQAIIGYVTFKDIVVHLRLEAPGSALRSIVRAIPDLPADLPIASALETLMRQRTHIALVRDQAGRVSGMITLEDIVEELVGDIQDEYDLLPVHVVVSGPGWLVGGGIGLERLREATGIELEHAGPEAPKNLSAWVIRQLGQPVTGGEVVERAAVRVLVRKVRRQRVLEALVTPLDSPSQPPTAH